MGTIVRIAALGAGLLLLGALYVMTAFPQMTGAAQMEADAMCNPVKMECGCMMIMVKGKCVGGPNMFMCPCFDVTSGFTTSGKCLAPNKCKGESVGGMMPMLPMIPMMMPKMDMMMPQDPCMQSGAGSAATTSTSTQQTNPCFGGGFGQGGSIFDTSSYFDDTSSSTSSLFDDLNQPTGSTVSTFLNNATATASTGTQQQAVVPTTSSQLTGSIKVGEVGASVIANLREGVAEVAGFFGGSTFGGNASQSVAGRLCANRPWSGSVISKIIPTSFFDTLCSKAGYQVGVSTPAPIQQVAVPKKTTPVQAMPPKKPVDLGPVEIDIWAEPSSVRLGTRTYIFWRSEGVLDCTVRGPNFTQNALAGGASTVPLSGATTYTLDCALPDGTTVSDSVTVQLAL
jgi:hypothetical protein